MSDNPEQLIEHEVQRRLARQTRQKNDEIAELRQIITDCQKDLSKQHELISRLVNEPLTFGTLLKVHNTTDPSKFKVNDEVIVVDPNSSHYQKTGRILPGPDDIVLDANGYCYVRLTDDTEEQFSVGLEGKDPAQIRLTKKEDGTYAVVQLDGKPWEVKGIPDLGLKVGDPVKIKPENKAIISKGYELNSGPICSVVAILDDCVEVMHKGDKFLVYNPNNLTLEEGDRIVTDPGMFCVTKKLPQDARQKYKVSDLGVTWDDIGGLENAKNDLRDALELPYQHPELFAHYGVNPVRGILLFGAPGNGKTLLARVSAWSIANTHGKTPDNSAFIYVKSPELLDKWVGNTEAEIRNLFERGRRHYRQHGYKAILAFDEADAIMPQRGTRRSSDISDTIVPMFLGEMDGIDSKQTNENPIVVLMTNRADVLDPAVTRPGRIDCHIKIDRPTELTAIDILEIHSKNIPFKDDRSMTLMMCCADLFSKSRLLYRINNEHDFVLGDTVSGAMLANIAEIAKMNALHRDLVEKKKTGTTIEDFRSAVKKVFLQQRGINHSFDLRDFSERLGIQAQDMKVDRVFSN